MTVAMAEKEVVEEGSLYAAECRDAQRELAGRLHSIDLRFLSSVDYLGQQHRILVSQSRILPMLRLEYRIDPCRTECLS